MEEEKLIQSITKSIGDKLKRPIILTYICVLILYNWDILFYLFFEKNSASSKIYHIKQIYSLQYFERILTCVAISIVLIILFTILNTLLNLSLMWFHRKDKEISSKIESYEKINNLTQQLSLSIDENKKLSKKIENLENINNELNVKKIDFKVSDISKKDFDNFLKKLNQQTHKEKYLYSFKELINMVKKENLTDYYKILNQSTYKDHMGKLIEMLIEESLISKDENYNNNSYYKVIEPSPSFKDFLKMEI